MKAISLPALRKRMKEHCDYVSKSMGVILITREKEERAIVKISIQEYNSLIETEHLFSKNPIEKTSRSPLTK
jgi:antitoxin YefM